MIYLWKRVFPLPESIPFLCFFWYTPKKGTKLITDSAQGRDSTVVFDGFWRHPLSTGYFRTGFTVHGLVQWTWYNEKYYHNPWNMNKYMINRKAHDICLVQSLQLPQPNHQSTATGISNHSTGWSLRFLSQWLVDENHENHPGNLRNIWGHIRYIPTSLHETSKSKIAGKYPTNGAITLW